MMVAVSTLVAMSGATGVIRVAPGWSLGRSTLVQAAIHLTCGCTRTVERPVCFSRGTSTMRDGQSFRMKRSPPTVNQPQLRPALPPLRLLRLRQLFLRQLQSVRLRLQVQRVQLRLFLRPQLPQQVQHPHNPHHLKRCLHHPQHCQSHQR